MALGRRGEREVSLWVATTSLPRSAGHPFYVQLNSLLAKASFDRRVEELCRSHYASRKGRPSIPPGVYFRMLMVGYFEGIDSQRGIAWRCSDSLSIRDFLGFAPAERSPEHSSMTVIRQRLPIEVFEEVFRMVLAIADGLGLVVGKTVAVDSTMLEANAAMKSIVRRDTGENWKQYILKLAEAEGLENPTEEDARRLDRGRKKKVSNQDWTSPTDPDSRITRMKDGRTHLAYKAEHVVDTTSGIILEASITTADSADHDTLLESVEEADHRLEEIGHDGEIEEIVADKGYHATETLVDCTKSGYRTYIPEPKSRGERRWSDKPDEHREAVYANRRRVRGERGRRLQRHRSEMVERTFAHVCETGGGRRSWVRGLANVTKSYAMRAAALNLSVVMRALIGIGKPRVLQGGLSAASLLILRVWNALVARVQSLRAALERYGAIAIVNRAPSHAVGVDDEITQFSTGC